MSIQGFQEKKSSDPCTKDYLDKSVVLTRPSTTKLSDLDDRTCKKARLISENEKAKDEAEEKFKCHAFQKFQKQNSNSTNLQNKRIQDLNPTRLLTIGCKRVYFWHINHEYPQIVIDNLSHSYGVSIDNGSFADVYREKDMVFKVSTLRKKTSDKQEDMDIYKAIYISALEEVKLLEILKHKKVRNICHDFYGHTIAPYQYCLHMPYLGVNLYNLDQHKITINNLFAIANCLLQTISDMESIPMVHGDLKPSNILYNPTTQQLSVIDFGLAKVLDLTMTCYPDQITRQALPYRSPRVLLRTPIGSDIDLWSVGCILFEFFTNKVLFYSPIKETYDDICHLALIIAILGSVPPKFIKSAALGSIYFVLSKKGDFIPGKKLQNQINFYKSIVGDNYIENKMNEIALLIKIDLNDPSFIKLKNLIISLVSYEHKKAKDYFSHFSHIDLSGLS